MDTPELARFREHYSSLPDAKLAELHAEGPTAYATLEVWQILDQEFERRGANAVDIQNDIVKGWHEGLKQAESEAPVEAQRARSLHRVGATAIDLLFLLSAGYVLVAALRDAGALVFLLVVLTYHPIAEFFAQRTLGKAALGLKLVTTSGSRPSLPAVVVRHLSRPLIGGLVWLAIYQTFGVHDIWSHTRVVYESQTPRSRG